MTETGLVLGRSILARMEKGTDDTQSPWPDMEEGRLLALLSVAAGHPVSSARMHPPIEAATKYWQQGDKALANLRLAFADLPRLHDPADADRVSLAEHLLDAGMSPPILMEALWPGWNSPRLEKYNPKHVPAGHGRRSGQFDFKSGTSRVPDGSIVVAGGNDDTNFQDRELFGETTAKEEFEHGRPITPSTGIPILGGQGGATGGLRTVDMLSAMARAAADKVGPGKGPVYGTAIHTELKEKVIGLGRQDLHPEQSYLNGAQVKYGTKGSVRVDFAEPTAQAPKVVHDLKTGGATLTNVRREQFRVHLPKRDDGEEVEMHEIRP